MKKKEQNRRRHAGKNVIDPGWAKLGKGSSKIILCLVHKKKMPLKSFQTDVILCKNRFFIQKAKTTGSESCRLRLRPDKAWARSQARHNGSRSSNDNLITYRGYSQCLPDSPSLANTAKTKNHKTNKHSNPSRSRFLEIGTKR